MTYFIQLCRDFTAILDGKNDHENAKNKWESVLPKLTRQITLESKGSAGAKSLLERQKIVLDEFDGEARLLMLILVMSTSFLLPFIRPQ